jgi:hypothetical protein
MILGVARSLLLAALTFSDTLLLMFSLPSLEHSDALLLLPWLVDMMKFMASTLFYLILRLSIYFALMGLILFFCRIGKNRLLGVSFYY